MIDITTYLIARILKKLRMSSIKDSKIHKTSAIESGSQIVSSSFDRHSYCGYDCTILYCDIGSFCSISDFVYIGGSQHPAHFVSTSPVFLSHRDSVKTKFAKHIYEKKPRTIIGHDVWIGHGAKIKGGVSVGNGSIIGMGSVVTKDVEPYSIVAGNPAKVIKYRFEKNIIEKLLQSKWWEGDDSSLRKMGVNCNNIHEYIESIDKK